jgi:hypothetical protein
VEQRLVEPGLELVGDDEEAVFRALERLGGLPLREAVHAGLGVVAALILDGAREGDERFVWVAVLAEVSVQRKLVAHGVQARAGDDHGLGLAADPRGRVRGEVLDHDRHLLADGVRVQVDEGPEQVFGGAAIVARVSLDLLEQGAQRALLGEAWQDLDLVFPNLEGGQMIKSNLLFSSYKPLLKKAGLPAVRFHDLRHTAATLLFVQGIHPKVVSEMLGHASVSITLDLYSHVLPNMQREAVGRMDELLSNRPPDV